MKKILLGLLASLSYCYASAAGYYVVIPKTNKGLNNVNDAISVSLNNVTVPPLFADEPYTLDLGAGLSVSGDPLFNGTGVSWTATNMLSGFTINNFGVLTGTTALSPRTYTLDVSAEYKGKKATRTVSLSIEEPRLRNIVDYSVGSTFSCAFNTSGEVWCWGEGNGNYATKKAIPEPIKAISVGASHACAIATSGAGYCWGDNFSGQTGAPSEGYAGFSSSPIQKPIVKLALNNLIDIQAGYNHTCAVTTNGAAYCWGHNGVGQLGNGTHDDSHLPTQVVGGGAGTYRAIYAQNSYSCGITTANSVNCWGQYTPEYNKKNIDSLPMPIEGLESGVAKLSLNAYHGCAIMASGRVNCWGHVREVSTSITVFDLGLSNVTEFMSRTFDYCYKANNEVRCWGTNDDFHNSIGFFPDVPAGAKIPLPGKLVTDNSFNIYFSNKGTSLYNYNSKSLLCMRKDGNIVCGGGGKGGNDGREYLANKALLFRHITNMGYVLSK